MKIALKILKLAVPPALIVFLIYALKGGTDIIAGLLVFFPLIYAIMGVLCTEPLRELLPCVVLMSLALLIPISISFNMGSCIEWALIYCALAFVCFFVKVAIQRAIRKRKSN